MVWGVPPVIAVVAGLALGALCGLINGALVAFGGLQPFIVTLGTLSTYRALALIFTGGNPILGVPASFRAVANGYFFGVPASVIVVIVVALIAFILLRKTP
jgi:ribose transport system permease protein